MQPLRAAMGMHTRDCAHLVSHAFLAADSAEWWRLPGGGGGGGGAGVSRVLCVDCSWSRAAQLALPWFYVPTIVARIRHSTVLDAHKCIGAPVGRG